MSFDDILNKPLPSAVDDEAYTESGDDDIDRELEAFSKEYSEDEDEIPDEGAEFDNDVMNGVLDEDDDEADEIDDAITALAGELDDDDEVDDLDEDDIEPEELTGEAAKQADQMLALCATPMIVEEACTIEEVSEFVESGDCEIAITEGFYVESDIDSMVDELSDVELYEEAAFASPGQKWKMTKKARFNQLFSLALSVEARAHKDPDYPRLMKAYAIERKIKKRWRTRYGAFAAKRAKVYMKRLMSSKSGTLAKAAKRFMGK